MAAFVESEVEAAALEWFRGLGYGTRAGADIGPGGVAQERASLTDVMLIGRLREAVARLNPSIPAAAHDDAIKAVQRRDFPGLIEENRRLHQLLVEGVAVSYSAADGRLVGDRVRLVDWDDVKANDWLVVNQVTVKDGQHHRRADIVLFLNGLPVAVVELKNPGDENATLNGAFNQLQTYKNELHSLFRHNEVLVVSDGIQARMGSLTAGFDRFVPWRTVDGEQEAPAATPSLSVLVHGLFERGTFLRYLRHFIAFEQDGKDIRKLLAGYHQYYAVNRAVETTVRASSAAGDRRVGVVWHTQGSGKSLTMVFYAGRIAIEPAMENPTLVVLTDRNDLDDQLFGQFARCTRLLRQTPERVESRADLRLKLNKASGGIVFTTIQKFFRMEDEDTVPALSERRNIIVLADEAHRSQYDFIDGYARTMREALPNASFIGFTGTPIELTDANTRAVFGEYISVYDIKQAVDDGATVPIYYESRLAKLELAEGERPTLDEAFEELTEGEEESSKQKLKTKWAALEAVVGAEKRVDLVAGDIVEHFEERQTALDGKALVVTMSRRIAVEMYDAIVALRPEWHADDDGQGVIKVVMTGSASDPPEWQRHIRPKEKREDIARRFKNPADPLKLVIVRDMWLTGFDVPCLHTMYVDKPMRGHGLMQAIARVNRVFGAKPGGLVVDYLGLADELRDALSTYSQGGGTGDATLDQREAVAQLFERYEVVCDLFHGFDWSVFKTGSSTQRLDVIGAGAEFILGIPEGKERLLTAVKALTLAFALSVPADEALAIRDDVAFFQQVRGTLAKGAGGGGKTAEELDQAVRQLVSRALVSDGVVDIFTVAGLERPDISVLSEEFLAEVRALSRENVAVEMLQRLINDEIKARSKRNVVQSRSFSEMLEGTLRRYQNRSIEAAQVIEELIQLAKDMKAREARGEKLGLSEEEVAFYDALAENESAVEVLGDGQLRLISGELVRTIKSNVTVDWTMKEAVQAKLRVLVRVILRRYGYPPDLQERAVQTVLEQAEALAEEWAAA